MDLKDMILVTENDRGTETNMLITSQSITGQQMLQFLQNSVEMMWNWDAFCKDIIMIQRNFTLIRQQVPQSVLQRWMRLE